MLERDLQRAIVDAAHYYGWLVHHTRTIGFRNGGYGSPGIDNGYPDLCLVKPATRNQDGSIKKHGQLIYAELKSDKGRLAEPQKIWLKALRDGGAQVYLWRPADLPAILKRLAN